MIPAALGVDGTALQILDAFTDFLKYIEQATSLETDLVAFRVVVDSSSGGNI